MTGHIISEANGIKESKHGRNSTRENPLNWDVFVASGIPMVTSDLPPGRETGDVEPEIVDFDLRRMRRCVRRRLYHHRASGRPHGLGRSERQELDNDLCHSRPRRPFLWHRSAPGSFPNARAVATPDVLKLMHQQDSPEFVRNFWSVWFPGQIPDRLVIAHQLEGDVIDLEGHDLVVVEVGHTDTDYTTVLRVPSDGLAVAGDVAYNDAHVYLAESNEQTRREWISALDTIESLNPRAVIAGQSNLRTTTAPRSSKRPGSTSAISTAWPGRRRPRESSTTRCWSPIRIG